MPHARHRHPGIARTDAGGGASLSRTAGRWQTAGNPDRAARPKLVAPPDGHRSQEAGPQTLLKWEEVASLVSAFASIWRMRSPVTPSSAPTSFRRRWRPSTRP